MEWNETMVGRVVEICFQLQFWLVSPQSVDAIVELPAVVILCSLQMVNFAQQGMRPARPRHLRAAE